jgi:hypothetical protein
MNDFPAHALRTNAGIFALSVDRPAWHLGGYQQQIDDCARVIASAKTDAAQATGHIHAGVRQ